MAVTNKGFIISDDQQSGAIFVEDTEKVAVGDKVCVWGTKSSDGAKLPIISCAEKSDDPNREGDKVEVLSSGATVTYPTPTDLTEQIDTYTSAERSYVTVTGFFNGSTVSVADDAKYSVSALDIPEEMGLAKLNGHNITVSGYYAVWPTRTPDHSDYDRGQGRSRNRLLDRRFRVARTLGYRRRQ